LNASVRRTEETIRVMGNRDGEDREPRHATGTINGWGRMFWGWRREADGTAVVTTWVTAFFLPILPLKRQRILLTPRGLLAHSSTFLTDLVDALEAAFRGIERRTFRYDLQAVLPLSLGDALATYAAAHLLGPILMAWPFVLLVVLLRQVPAGSLGTAWGAAAIVLGFIACMANLILVVIAALLRGRVFR
jgi:hypothetical protein